MPAKPFSKPAPPAKPTSPSFWRDDPRPDYSKPSPFAQKIAQDPGEKSSPQSPKKD